MSRPVREPEHRPRGDPCALCALPASRHRRRRAGKAARRREDRRLADLARPMVGIDGEGRDLPCPRCGECDRDLQACPAGDGEERCQRPHAYTYLSAVSEDGRKLGSLSHPHGIPSERILAFLCDLGEPRLFGYSLGYDVTMWLANLPDQEVYELVRPESRARTLPDGRTVRRRTHWQGFEIDYLRRRLDLRRADWDERAHRWDRGPATVVWDLFGFYQASFVRSLADWQTAPAETIARIKGMKDRRAEFSEASRREVEAYCDEECLLLARLTRQLVEAHEEARLPLKTFYGAGSTASALLDRMGTKEHRGPKTLGPELDHAVQSAFFGGRFECSRIGPVAGPVWNYDISSAYPYQAAGLPCLACGAWRRYSGREADRKAREGRLAVVRCRVRTSRRAPTAWGPLPWRCPPTRRDQIGEADAALRSAAAEALLGGWGLPEEGLVGGSIVWPLRLDETWVWRDEYLAAKDTLWPNVEALEAWVYDCDCAHTPFREVPEVYRERCRIGKEGAGIVYKLGNNSVYGKTAQSVGSAPFRSWVWAGCITSGCRAQALRAIACSADPASVIMIATDGIQAAERLSLPAPRDTGTGDCLVGGLRKPLGGWEEKEIPGGVFVARPGIYWPLGEAAAEKTVKARGISRSVLGGMTCPDHRERVSPDPGACPREGCGRPLERQSALIEQHFAERGWREPYRILGCVRFVGAKGGTRMTPDGPVRSDRYGCWEPYPIEVSFSPDPKRASVRRDLTLEPWERMPGPSAPYRRDQTCPEGQAMRELEENLREQPEGELEFR